MDNTLVYKIWVTICNDAYNKVVFIYGKIMTFSCQICDFTVILVSYDKKLSLTFMLNGYLICQTCWKKR